MIDNQWWRDINNDFKNIKIFYICYIPMFLSYGDRWIRCGMEEFTVCNPDKRGFNYVSKISGGSFADIFSLF